MVVIKYALVGCLVALGLFGFSKRDEVVAAYHWDPTIEKRLIPSFDPKAVADKNRLAVPETDLRIALAPDTRNAALPVAPGALPAPPMALQGGQSSLDGLVVGPNSQPVVGATVRIERFVEDRVVSVDLITNATGNFAINRLLGGRYRVRAWQAPTLAQLGSEVTFLNDGDNRAFRLALDAPIDIALTADAASATVILGQATTVSMLIENPVINANGQVARVGRAGDLVVATGSGVFAGQGGSTTTNAAGNATFTAQCTQLGAGSFSLATPYFRESVTVVCVPVPTTTTTTSVAAPVPATPVTTVAG